MTAADANLDRLRKIVASDSKARELDQFAETARSLAVLEATLIDAAGGQWVGMYADKIVARSATLDGLLEDLAKKNVPANRTVVRFLSKEEVIV